jgi:regulatory protein
VTRTPRTAVARAAAAEERRSRRARVTDAAVVVDAAAAYLAARPRTVSQTRAHLRRLGFPAPLCDQAIARLEELGYLDDLAFARAWVEARDRSRPRGEAALRQELAGKGVDAAAVAAVLAERRDGRPHADGAAAPGADRAAAERLLERRMPALLREADPRRRRQRAYALLARSGFDPDVCREASLRLVADAPDPGAEAAAD